MLAGLAPSECWEEDLFAPPSSLPVASGTPGLGEGVLMPSRTVTLGTPGLGDGALMPSRELPGVCVCVCVRIPPSDKDTSCMGWDPT